MAELVFVLVDSARVPAVVVKILVLARSTEWLQLNNDVG